MEKFDFMKLAISEGEKSLKYSDVPVGAVIVKDGRVLSRAHNLKEKKKSCICHAEILAIHKASKKIKNFRLNDCEIYITKEPCIMCMGAILSARIKKIYFGANDKRFGTINFAKENNFNHKCEYEGGVLKEECEKLLSSFFAVLRSENEDIRKN